MIIGIIGLIGSGKNTLSDILVRDHGFTQDSFARTLKDVASVLFGWPRQHLEGLTEDSRLWRESVDHYWSQALGIPDFTPRFALQHLGTDVLRNHFHDSIWLLSLFRRYYQNGQPPTVISDVRYTNELDEIRRQGGVILRVTRGEAPPWYSVATRAAAGDSVAIDKMTTDYSNVHISEWALSGVPVDHEISNNGTVSDLESQIRTVLDALKRP